MVFYHSQWLVKIPHRPFDNGPVLVILPPPLASQSVHIVESGRIPHVSYRASDSLEHSRTLSRAEVMHRRHRQRWEERQESDWALGKTAYCRELELKGSNKTA
jgi:hypothetical protein